MLASLAFSKSSTTTFNSRIFVFEVTNLFDQEPSLNRMYSVRQGKNHFYQVPFSQMNQVMQRFTRLGAKIVSIQPLDAFSADQKATSSSANDEGND